MGTHFLECLLRLNSKFISLVVCLSVDRSLRISNQTHVIISNESVKLLFGWDVCLSVCLSVQARTFEVVHIGRLSINVI